jgi:uncharacterized linocin/CFP29 family protein
MRKNRNEAIVSSGRALMRGSSGKWAGEQLVRAASQGKPLTAQLLRTLNTLRRDEWIEFDTAITEEAVIQLNGVADLITANLVRPVPNSLGKTLFGYERATDMDDAQISMDPVSRTDYDRGDFDLAQVPLPITHKDWYLNLRVLSASREKGESLDTSTARLAGRKVAERSEQTLFQGAGKSFGGFPVYGYCTHPNRTTASYGTHGNWLNTNTAKTGDDILNDVLTMLLAAQTARHFGPYWLYVSRDSSVKLSQDFKANTQGTIRERLLKVEGIDAVKSSDKMPAATVILVQHTSDVVQLLQGENLQTVQWDVEGGFHINFKAFQIQVPLIKADIAGRSGIVHMS